MKVSFYTLGCKVNQNETGALQQLFCQNGYTLAAPGEAADVYVVNSCTVTNFGDQKSRKWLRRAKRENPQAVTVLTGCYPQASPQEAAGVLEADVVTGSRNRHSILPAIRRYLDTGCRVVEVEPHQRGEAFEELPMERFENHTRAFIKVEDGCDRQCAYCIIPRARGPVRSRSQQSILHEAAALVQGGYREIVLSAISLPSYGKDTHTNMVELVEALAELPGLARIRLGSLDPDMLTDDYIARLAQIGPLCPQFHLSLQSGCTATLRRMRRPYTAEQYRTVVEKLRAAFDRPVSFTTDVIVGFPGETEEEFAQSLAFVESIGFLKVHVFPYSRRPGTPAAEMDGQLSEAQKAQRSRKMGAMAETVRTRLAMQMKGRTAEVLLETPLSATLFTGYTPLYLPVAVSAPGHRSGDIVQVELGNWDGERCEAVSLK